MDEGKTFQEALEVECLEDLYADSLEAINNNNNKLILIINVCGEDNDPVSGYLYNKGFPKTEEFNIISTKR